MFTSCEKTANPKISEEKNKTYILCLNLSKFNRINKTVNPSISFRKLPCESKRGNNNVAGDSKSNKE